MVGEDPNEIIPNYRLDTQLPIDPLPDAAAFVAVIKAVMLGQYLSIEVPSEVGEEEPQELQDARKIKAAMVIEYYRPVVEHTLIINRPVNYPNLGM